MKSRYNNRNNFKKFARNKFEKLCIEVLGWEYDYCGFHETRVHASKLISLEKYLPSYIIDIDFHNPEAPLYYVEVKTLDKERGETRISNEEFKAHDVINKGRPVLYALYNPSYSEWCIYSLDQISTVMRPNEKGYLIDMKDLLNLEPFAYYSYNATPCQN